MKNLINYFYNLIVNDFRKIDNYYLFEIDNIKYAFLEYDGNIDELYNMYTIIINNNKYCHEIVLNKDNRIVTFYQNKPYILIKKNIYLNTFVTLAEIINYDVPIYVEKERKVIWDELWMNKIDYYEYQMNELGNKYQKLKLSFNYYVGLSECAINLLKYLNNDNIKFYITHKRIMYKEKTDELLNPINLIIDTRVRDIAEYFKINYINNNYNIQDIIKEIDMLNLDYNESILLLSRLMYPSFYFDLYDKIIQEKIDESKIDFYIEKNVYYETFLRYIYKFLKSKYKIPNIEWLES